MTELQVHNFSISLDGYAAGPSQSLDDPLGVGGEQLHEWIFPADGDRTPVDERAHVRLRRTAPDFDTMGA